MTSFLLGKPSDNIQTNIRFHFFLSKQITVNEELFAPFKNFFYKHKNNTISARLNYNQSHRKQRKEKIVKISVCQIFSSLNYICEVTFQIIHPRKL